MNLFRILQSFISYVCPIVAKVFLPNLRQTSKSEWKNRTSGLWIWSKDAASPTTRPRPRPLSPLSRQKRPSRLLTLSLSSRTRFPSSRKHSHDGRVGRGPGGRGSRKEPVVGGGRGRAKGGRKERPQSFLGGRGPRWSAGPTSTTLFPPLRP